MRSQNRKVKVTKSGSALVGRAGCLGLLALGLALVNPMSCLSAFAEEEAEEVGALAVQSDFLPSSVQISFGEPVGVSSLTPIDANGASALYSVKATVDVANSGGYTVYLGSNKAELTGKNSGATINGVTSSSSYEGMPVNSWGYAYSEGEDAGTTFSAMPANIRGVTLGGNNSTNIKTDSKTFTLSFAAHIGNDKPADTYENEVTMSVVSSPREVASTWEEITTMQEMTSEICSSVDTPAAFTETGAINTNVPTKRLRDTRDDNYYWVAKLADGNCWMTQNLALNITEEGLSANDTDINVDWNSNSEYPPVATLTTNAPFAGNAVGVKSWNVGIYTIDMYTDIDCRNSTVNVGLSSSQCLSAGIKPVGDRVPSEDPGFLMKTTFLGTDGVTSCSKSQGSALSNAASGVCAQYDAHYSGGNYYQWNTATAGSGGTILSNNLTTVGLKDADTSICPKNWMLLRSGGTGDRKPFLLEKSLASLFGQYGWSEAQGLNAQVINGAPMFFVRFGKIMSTGVIDAVGRGGYYWSSTAYNNTSDAFGLAFGSSTDVQPSTNRSREYGESVRCVAR